MEDKTVSFPYLRMHQHNRLSEQSLFYTDIPVPFFGYPWPTDASTSTVVILPTLKKKEGFVDSLRIHEWL